MKVLFIDNSAELQQKWIEPLRAKGWGAMQVRTVEDADKVVGFHGDSIVAVAVSEAFTGWAESQDFPCVVITRVWTEAQIARHQSSKKPAVAYLPVSAQLAQIVQVFESCVRFTQSSNQLKATGSDNSVSLALENFSETLSKPETTRTSLSDPSIKLDAPTILLGGKPAESTSSIRLAADISLDEAAQNKTLLIEKTKVGFETPAQEVSISTDPLAELQIMSLEATRVTQISQPATSTPVMQANPSPVHFSMNAAHGSVPGDVETLKSYLALREQDVAVLTGQMRSSHERLQQLEMQLKVERARSNELQHMVQKQEQQIQNFERDKQIEFEVLYKQIEDLNGQLKDRTDKARTIEAKLKMTTDEVEKVKERVRVDIRRIRVREKELESQLEVLKKDSSALLMARDEKILDLKRKLDLLEFNMELVQEQYSKEREATDQLRTRLKHAASAMREAGGLLDHEN